MQTLVSATVQVERESEPKVTTKVRTARRFLANVTRKALVLVVTSADSHTKGPKRNRAAKAVKAGKRTTQEIDVKVRKGHESTALGKVVSRGCLCV